MVRVARIFRDYQDAGSVNGLLALWGFVDDTTFLTKAGRLGPRKALRCAPTPRGGADGLARPLDEPAAGSYVMALGWAAHRRTVGVAVVGARSRHWHIGGAGVGVRGHVPGAEDHESVADDSVRRVSRHEVAPFAERHVVGWEKVPSSSRHDRLSVSSPPR